MLIAEDGSKSSAFRVDSLAEAAGRSDARRQTYELGICLAEVAWPTDDIAAVLIKNCHGGTVLFVSYDFVAGKLTAGQPYAAAMRQALARRYGKELATFRGDPLRWVESRQADEAYLWKRLGGGRLMGGDRLR